MLWAVLLCVILRLLTPAQLKPFQVVVAVSLTLFAFWTLVSAWWGSSTERAFIEFDRVGLYLGVFLLGSLVVTPEAALRVRNGIAAAVAGVGFVALASRFFPQTFSERGLPEFLPDTATRLSFPLDYWNGLGIFLALGLPILLEIAVGRTTRWAVRNAAVSVLPALALAIYLTSSRGAVATAAAGVLTLIALSRDRWAPPAACACGIVGLVVALVLLHRLGLADEASASTRGGRAEGAGETAVVVLGCAVAGAAYALLSRLVAGRRPRPRIGSGVAVLVTAVLVVVAVASHPVRKFESFKQPPAPASAGASGITSHLFSASGNGRWQFWGAAIDQLRAHPVKGTGAGTYEEWWLQHRTIPAYVKDAHSLWLEVLGELGLVGLVLIGIPFGAAVVVGAGVLLKASSGERAPKASALAVVVAYCVAAAVDWMWELTAVSVVAFLCLGLLVGLGTASEPRRIREPRTAHRLAVRLLPMATAVLLLSGLLCAQGILLLTDRSIRGSRLASRSGNYVTAVARAERARRLEPWAATPYLQRALIEERLGHFAAADTAIRKAIRRDPSDWKLWFVAARVQTERGAIFTAVRSIHQAQRLNPKAPFVNPPSR